KGGSSSIFTLLSLPVGAELTFEAEELLLPLAGVEDGSFIVTPLKVSALNVDFDLKTDLIVFGLEIGSTPSNFFSEGRGVLQTEDSSAESYSVTEESLVATSDKQGLSTPGLDTFVSSAEDFTKTRPFCPKLEGSSALAMRPLFLTVTDLDAEAFELRRASLALTLLYLASKSLVLMTASRILFIIKTILKVLDKRVFTLNISEEDIKPQPNSPLQEIIILDPDDQLMWESTKNVAPTSDPLIARPSVDDNFVINSTHLKMICENKFDGYLRADPHDHIRELLAICDMFKYGETQSEAVKHLIFPFSLCDKAKAWCDKLNEEFITSRDQMRRAFTNRFFPPSLFNRLLLEIRNFSQNVCESLTEACLKEEMHEMRKNYNNHGGDHGSKNDDTPMCEHHEANYIQSESYQNRNYHDSYSHQSHHDPNDSEKSLNN
ncbi:reverse transcriptase domain-containing protein, partial [Tanacetum coccineum]